MNFRESSVNASRTPSPPLSTIVKVSCMSYLWFLESFRQLTSRLSSSMSHKAEGLSLNRCRNKERSLSLTTNDKGSVSSVSCEKLEVAHLLLGAGTQIS